MFKQNTSLLVTRILDILDRPLLSLSNGLYTLLLQATDAKPQTTSQTRSFEMKKTTGFEDPAITEGIKV
jgi:hypothetical protein